jgi:lipopolysaccharide export system permease protein
LIIDKHLVRQVVMPFFSVSMVLLIIFVGYSLSRFLYKADAGLLNTSEVTLLTLLKALIALEVLLPIGLFFGLMLGLGKLHSDSEIVAMQASGISESRMLRPVALLAIPLALLIACLSIYVRPWAWSQTYQMLAIAEASSDIDRVKPGQFYLTSKPASSEGEDSQPAEEQERAIFIENISAEQVLDHVFIRTRSGDEIQVISSRTGLLMERPGSNYQALELDNARIFKRVDDGPDLFAKIEHFTMKVVDAQPEPPEYKSKAVATEILASSPNPKDRSEYQWRLSNPITTLLLALLAIPLSRSRPRQGRYAKLLLAFVIYAAYYNLIGISRTWVEQQTTASIWWVPSLLALLVVLSFLPWHALGYKLSSGNNDHT